MTLCILVSIVGSIAITGLAHLVRTLYELRRFDLQDDFENRQLIWDKLNETATELEEHREHHHKHD